MRKIILYTESLRIAKPIVQQPEQFSYDGRAIIGLLKNNIEALRSGNVDIEPVGFEGKDQFMKELPLAVRNAFTEYRHRSNDIKLFIIALRDADTKNEEKIANLRNKIAGKIIKKIGEHEFSRVKIMFAVQAIEAWILADEQELNKYLGVTNKVKHENDPEGIKSPKQKLTNYFEKYRDRIYTTQDLLDLLPMIRLSALLRCKHFNEFYTCMQKIVKGAE